MQLSTQQKPQPFQRNHKIRNAISKAIYDEMANDPAIIESEKLPSGVKVIADVDPMELL